MSVLNTYVVEVHRSMMVEASSELDAMDRATAALIYEEYPEFEVISATKITDRR